MSKVDLDEVEERAREARRRPTTVPGYLVTKAEIAAVVASAEDVPALVAELRATREANDKLKSALERTRDNFISAIRGHRVRDMAETLAEVDAALAAYEKVTGE